MNLDAAFHLNIWVNVDGRPPEIKQGRESVRRFQPTRAPDPVMFAGCTGQLGFQRLNSLS